MALLSDCLTAGGTLAVAIGSGLQAGSELKRYGAVARRLGLAEAANAAVGLFRAGMQIYGDFPLLFWRLPADFKSYIAATKRNFRAARAIGSSELTNNEKIEARELSRKSMYWFLIMLGTFTVFIATIVAIIMDVR